jgi:type IV secretory pathway VirB4 component
MAGACIIIVGARGSGKSTTLKNRLKKANKNALLIFDVNKEHQELYNKPFVPFDSFAKKATLVENAVIVIEEATIYLSNRGHNTDVKTFLVQARHNNNTVFLVYHSFRSIPNYIFELCDYAIIHKTSDTPEFVIDRFKHADISTAFTQIKNAAWIDSGKKKNGKPVEYSPHKVVAIY